MSAFLALALLTSSKGIYICSASERIDPGTWAVFQSRFENGVAGLPSFHIRYVADPGEAITQQMEWYDLPRWNEHPGAPDTIGFHLPTAKTDRKGLLRFTAGGQSWAVEQETKFIRAKFGSAWVEFQGYSERNKFWKGSGWRVEALDRLDRVTGTTDIRMPGPEKVQQIYGRLRADLARFEADRPRHCKYYSPPEPGEEDPGAIVQFTGSGSSDPA
ncbi:MAG: hypothetical protein ACXWU6_03670 [Allosphingosinicella sp.]